MVRYFTLEYWVDEGWYVGRLKEVPGVFSQGVSLQELEENIQDAYQLMMEEEESPAPRRSSDEGTGGRGVKRRDFIRELGKIDHGETININQNLYRTCHNPCYFGSD